MPAPITKFKPEIINNILEKIKKHIPYKKACLSNGVSERCFYLWIKQGEEDLANGKSTDHSDFVKRLNNIESDRIDYHLNNVQFSENGHKGAQWVLERVFWRYFSPKVAEIELNERVEALEKQKEMIDADSSDQEEKLCDETEKR